MPMPESVTATSMVSDFVDASNRRTWHTTSPSRVNLMALESRLSRICLRRSASPRTIWGSVWSRQHTTSRPFLEAMDDTLSSASSTTLCTSKSTYSNSSLPLSTWVRSRMSLMRLSSESEEDWMSLASSCCSWSSLVCSNSWFTPMMPLSGVRISWDMLARNCDLASLAARERLSCASAAMARRLAVMSCPTPTTPTMLPSASRRGLAFSSRSTRRPLFLVKSGNSNDAVSRPCSALSSTFFTLERKSGEMKFATSSLPITSATL
mmetsp:Transcript_10965/g.20642  ORF Transcript_10965/g.20642 Transcript_10965/m.20642 type:complete len:265 (-) Transcript_10965:1298-2092(-)